MPMSAKNAFSNALGFFKAQKTEEKKIIDENKFVKEVQKREKEVPASTIQSPSKTQQNIALIQLPKSPYLQNVKRKIEMPSSFSILVQPTIVKATNEPETKVSSVPQPMMTSPFIGLNATKE